MATPDSDRFIRPDRTVECGAKISRLVLASTSKLANGRRVYQLDEPLRFYLPLNSLGHIALEVPQGTETDLASVPRFLWWLFPHDEVAEEAVFHDSLCSSKYVDRFVADAIFRAMIAIKGRSYWKQLCYFYGVRIGAWMARRHRKHIVYTMKPKKQ